MAQTQLPLLPLWAQYLQALGPVFVALVVGSDSCFHCKLAVKDDLE